MCTCFIQCKHKNCAFQNCRRFQQVILSSDVQNIRQTNLVCRLAKPCRTSVPVGCLRSEWQELHVKVKEPVSTKKSYTWKSKICIRIFLCHVSPNIFGRLWTRLSFPETKQSCPASSTRGPTPLATVELWSLQHLGLHLPPSPRDWGLQVGLPPLVHPYLPGLSQVQLLLPLCWHLPSRPVWEGPTSKSSKTCHPVLPPLCQSGQVQHNYLLARVWSLEDFFLSAL